MDIKEKIALVTGGANGLGFAYARELLRNGAAHVAILDLANSNGEESAKKLNDQFGPGKALFVICDVTEPKELEAGFAKIVSEFGGLDILINNAGIMNERQWDLMVNINYNAVVRGTLLGMEYMGKDKGGKGGTIVNVASIVGIVPISAFPIYTGTKHAVVGFSRSMAQPYHYTRSGVRIMIMCPGVTDTQLITEISQRTLEIVTPEEVDNVLKSWPAQPISNVTQGVMHMLRIGENGSVWFSGDGECVYEIQVPDHPVKKVPVKV